MNKNLEELKKVRKDCGLNMHIPMTYLIPLLEDFEEKLEMLGKQVKRLEQQQTCYPFSEEELMKEPVGGTD